MGYYGYYYGFDWTYILVLIGAVLSLLASARVNSSNILLFTDVSAIIFMLVSDIA